MAWKFSTTLSCKRCLAKVQPKLDSVKWIQRWSIDWDHPDKLLTVEASQPGNPQHVIDLLRQAGYDGQIMEGSSPIAKVPYSSSNRAQNQEESGAKWKLSTYKPLLLVISYVLGASLLWETAQSEWHWMRVMNHFMGFFFTGFAFFKLLDIGKFADAFSTYDVIAKRSRWYGLAYPWIELAIGILFLTQSELFFVQAITFVIMSTGLIGVISAVRQKRAIQCACLGTVFNLPMSVVTIVENGAMIAMSLTMMAI